MPFAQQHRTCRGRRILVRHTPRAKSTCRLPTAVESAFAYRGCHPAGRALRSQRCVQSAGVALTSQQVVASARLVQLRQPDWRGPAEIACRLLPARCPAQFRQGGAALPENIALAGLGSLPTPCAPTPGSARRVGFPSAPNQKHYVSQPASTVRFAGGKSFFLHRSSTNTPVPARWKDRLGNPTGERHFVVDLGKAHPRAPVRTLFGRGGELHRVIRPMAWQTSPPGQASGYRNPAGPETVGLVCLPLL